MELLLNILLVKIIFERKYYNFILNFVSIIITTTVILITSYNYNNLILYFSFLLIIVYSSALSILFGFIIMLDHKSTFMMTENIISFKYILLIGTLIYLIGRYEVLHNVDENNINLKVISQLKPISEVFYNNIINGTVYLFLITILLTLALLSIFFILG